MTKVSEGKSFSSFAFGKVIELRNALLTHISTAKIGDKKGRNDLLRPLSLYSFGNGALLLRKPTSPRSCAGLWDSSQESYNSRYSKTIRRCYEKRPKIEFTRASYISMFHEIEFSDSSTAKIGLLNMIRTLVLNLPAADQPSIQP